VILGLSLPTFTLLHVVLSLCALVTGGIVLFAMLCSLPLPRVTTLFLAATLGTSLTGLLFQSTRVGPGHIVCVLSLVALMPTLFALYVRRLAGAWRRVFVAGATAALSLNAAIGLLQVFARIPYLQPLVGTPVPLIAGLALIMVLGLLGALAALHTRAD
jgi:hypothetical protein